MRLECQLKAVDFSVLNWHRLRLVAGRHGARYDRILWRCSCGCLEQIERHEDTDNVTIRFQCAGPFAGKTSSRQITDCRQYNHQEAFEHRRGLQSHRSALETGIGKPRSAATAKIGSATGVLIAAAIPPLRTLESGPQPELPRPLIAWKRLHICPNLSLK